VAFVSDQIVSRDVPVDIDFVVEQLTLLWANAIGLNSDAKVAPQSLRG